MSGRAKDFKWTDNKAELLLTDTHNYKIAKVSENVDWESVKSKYDDILSLMIMPYGRMWRQPGYIYTHLTIISSIFNMKRSTVVSQ